MKKLLTLFAATILFVSNTLAQDPMVLIFDTNLSDGTTITLPLYRTVNVTVNWGDGTEDTYTTAGNKSHTYDTDGEYTVSITGSLTQFGAGSVPYSDVDKLVKVTSFGDLGLTNLSGAFRNAVNLVEVPEALPSMVTNLSHLFSEASSFNQPIGNWDVSSVTNMRGMFNMAHSFNQDIGNWDVSKVTDMSYMFWVATAFNQPIGNWDVSSVTNMQDMYSYATSFNQNIGNWDVSGVTTMRFMFNGATSFNQDIGGWDVSNVTNTSRMFSEASAFNQPIGDWDVSKVRNMYGMFYKASAFNQPIGDWDVSSVTNMESMFSFTASFNQDIGNWDVSKVTDMSYMFWVATAFNQPIGNWDVSKTTNMRSMFRETNSFNQPIGNWDVSNVRNMSNMFWGAEAFNQPIGNWDVNNVTNLSNMFTMANPFNQPIGNWDVSNVTDMSSMFWIATAFNQPIGDWDVGKVTNMNGMFYYATSFNQPVGDWDVNNVTNMSNIFNGVTLSTANYNHLLKGWGTQALKEGISFHGGSSKYSVGEPSDARQHIIDTYGWTITDGGISNLPAVSTAPVTEITPTSATSGGEVSYTGGSDVTSRGLVWHTEPNPTLANHIGLTTNGEGLGSFISSISALELGTSYFVRAYATNGIGTDYGPSVSFTASQELLIAGSFTAQNKVYDGSVTATLLTNGLSLQNAIEGHKEVSLSSIDIEFDDKNVGTSKTVSIVSASLAGDDAFKYYLSLNGSPLTTANINPKELTIGGSFTSHDKVYDGNHIAEIDENHLSLVGVVGSDDVSISNPFVRFAFATAGNDILVLVEEADLEGTDSQNYWLSTEEAPTTTASITPKELTISGSFTANSKIYDGSDVASIGQDDLSLEGVLGYDHVVLGTLQGQFAQADVGESIPVTLHSASLDGYDKDNYWLSLAGSPTTTASITPKSLSINGFTGVEPKAYDGNTTATLEGEPSFEGLVEGDESGVSIASVEANFAQSTPGTLIDVSVEVSLEGEKAPNYTVESPSWIKGTITPKELTIGGSFTAKDKEHDGTNEAEIDENNLTLVGVVGEEDVSLFNLHARFAQVEVGNDIVVSLYVAALEGDQKDNYWLTLEGAPTTTASITYPTSVSHSTLANVMAYPNPFNSHIYLEADEPITRVIITSVTGQVVLAQQLNGEQQVSVGNLPNGVYLVTVELKDGLRKVLRMVRQ